MQRGQTEYTDVDGISELKDAIVAKFERENGLDYKRSQISVGTGGKQVLFHALLATLDPGRRWRSNRLRAGCPTPISCCSVAASRCSRPAALRMSYKLEPETLDEALTRQIVTSSTQPSNFPTAPQAYTKAEELKALTDVLVPPKNRRVWVMTDDMYEHLIYDSASSS